MFLVEQLVLSLVFNSCRLCARSPLRYVMGRSREIARTKKKKMLAVVEIQIRF